MRFENRLVLSAMAGINDADFCRNQKAALVILGGFSADKTAMEAAKMAAMRGRKEFIFSEPLDGIEREIKNLKREKFAVNVRSGSLEGYMEVAEIVERYGGILEINAHCRQPEFVSAGCGEWLLFNPEKLLEITREVSKISTTFVKIRGSHPIDYERLASKIFSAGAKAIHIDAMIPNGGCNFSLISRISRYGPVIGNNSFTDIESGEKIIRSGARMASAARAVLKDMKFFEKMLRSGILSQPVEL
ncbi:MJ0144 family RNA dihydrouridine synthase-like protein [Archaeoglobus neptunius]|uniref:MJ0144 family RNA dihydrouridine synthase-like protein n=1 Tax=Archaeoglobus neptunius TaxID=2798580 RepID=UPI00192841BC|nr:MJ0144 family RNA dihydrouridine synthase-like protein [Archaeoglobus neptunius]